MDGNRAASIRGRHPNSSSVSLAIVLAVLFPPWAGASRWQTVERPREFAVVARDFGFTPSQIEVRQNEVVRINFTAADMAHGFAIDEYRIAKRAAAGQTIVLEFRADRAGRFRIYCNLTADDRHHQMAGELLVRPGSFSQ